MNYLSFTKRCFNLLSKYLSTCICIILKNVFLSVIIKFIIKFRHSLIKFANNLIVVNKV